MIQFFVQLVVTYSLAKLSAPDGPKLTDSEHIKGNFGAPIPRVYGGAVRLDNCEFIAFGPLVEKKRKVKKNWFDKAMNILSPITNLLPQPSYYTYSRSFAVLIADRTNDDPIEDVLEIWANGKRIFRRGSAVPEAELLDANGGLIYRRFGKDSGTHSLFESITIYGGGFEQTADPTVASYTDDTQGYRGTAYFSIKKLELQDFGNSTPQLDVLVKAKDGESLATFAEAVSAAAGMDPQRNVSTTALVSKEVRGYAVLQESTCWEAIRPLLPAHRVDASEVAGQIRFFERGNAMRYVIPENDMAGHIYGDERPALWNSARSPDVGLPKEYSFTFRDPARDYQANTQFSRRSEGDASSNISASVAVTLTADEGRQTAELLHWEAWAARLAKTFTLTDQWIGVSPGDVYGHQSPDGIRPHRITRKTRGANGIIEIESVSDEFVVYRSAASGNSGVVPENPVQLIVDTRLVLIDGPIMADLHDDDGFYIALAGEGTGWRGATVQRSDGTYEDVVDTFIESVIGDVQGTLAAGATTGLDDTLDNVTVLTVDLLHSGMVLEDATLGELTDDLANVAWVGGSVDGEILQFTTAVKTIGTTWELTGLLRGRRGTDHAIATHGAGETFVLLEADALFRVDFGDDDWNLSRDYRAVSEYQDEADADVVAFTNTGEGKRPYSPVNVEGDWDGSNDLTITFEARSRMNSGGLGIDDRDEYEVEILSGAGRVELTATESWVYTAADQITDGLTPGGTIEGRVRQTSDVNDGRWRDFEIVGPLSFRADSTLETADDTFLTADMG